MNVRIESSWKNALSEEFEAEYFHELTEFVRSKYAVGQVFPPASKIFAAFDACPLPRVKAVILGQDPYHGPGQANGMCFSVSPGIPFPPSLQNIFKEVCSDTGAAMPQDGDLSRWAEQGVFLLNATLTVDAHRAGSHQGRGWERFTDAVIRRISDSCDHVVFMLWGSYAIKKAGMIDRDKHLVLTSPHPSPLSAYRGFFGNRHFSICNSWLSKYGKEPVVW